MKRLCIVLCIFFSLLWGISIVSSREMQDMHGSAGVPAFSYRIVNSYPHDRTAFTQGLVYDGGYLYEGTGLHGYSSLRKVELESGNILKMRKLDPRHFGEGITVLGNRIIQLTYRSRIGFVYEKSSFNLLRTFNYFGEGWGITHDGKCLIMSDGTSKLSFLDPETFGVVKTVVVHDYRGEITGLNELEFVEGEVFANIWEEDRIARIDPETGRITGWIELGGLLAPADGGGFVDVLNGIAYDPLNHRLFVTGKLWPKIFEIELIRKK